LFLKVFKRDFNVRSDFNANVEKTVENRNYRTLTLSVFSHWRNGASDVVDEISIRTPGAGVPRSR